MTTEKVFGRSSANADGNWFVRLKCLKPSLNGLSSGRPGGQSERKNCVSAQRAEAFALDGVAGSPRSGYKTEMAKSGTLSLSSGKAEFHLGLVRQNTATGDAVPTYSSTPNASAVESM